MQQKTAATKKESEGCPQGHDHCEGHDAESEYPVLCFDCWDVWAAYDPDDFTLPAEEDR